MKLRLHATGDVGPEFWFNKISQRDLSPSFKPEKREKYTHGAHKEL